MNKPASDRDISDTQLSYRRHQRGVVVCKGGMASTRLYNYICIYATNDRITVVIGDERGTLRIFGQLFATDAHDTTCSMQLGRNSWNRHLFMM